MKENVGLVKIIIPFQWWDSLYLSLVFKPLNLYLYCLDFKNVSLMLGPKGDIFISPSHPVSGLCQRLRKPWGRRVRNNVKR